MLGQYTDYPINFDQAPKEINLKDYTLAQERFDERFGLIFFMRSKSSARTIFVKERSASLPYEQIQEISNRLRITDNYLLNIYGMKQVPESGLFQIYFEDFSTDLQSEIKRHLAEKTRFSEAELYAILYSAVSALSALEQSGISHNFVVPMNLLKFDKDLYKLHDNFSINNKSYLYNHALRGQYLRYVAPELLESLTRQKEQPDHHDPHKADVFALGMCLLDAGLLNTEGNFINKKLMILDEKALQQSIQKFGQIYSSAMVTILQDMLFPDPSQRPSSLTLYQRLPGKPLQKNQAGGRKRKILDQIINNNSPDKYEALRDSRLSYSSPVRFSIADEMRQSLLASGGGAREQSFYGNNQSESLKRGSVPVGIHAYQQHDYTSGQDTDISKINVSPSIKNDPVLSQFVKKLVDPTYNIRGSPSRSELERSHYSVHNTGNAPTPILSYSQVNTGVSPGLTPILSYSQPDNYFRETEKRSYVQSSYNPAQQNYTFHDQERSNPVSSRSYGGYAQPEGYEVPKSSYNHPLPTGTHHLGTLQGVDTIVDVISQPNSERHQESYGGNNQIHDMINKALERSSNNLYLSQKTSDQNFQLDDHHHENGVNSIKSSQISTHSQQSGKIPGLATIYERTGSEDFTTPVGSNFDLAQERTRNLY